MKVKSNIKAGQVISLTVLTAQTQEQSSSSSSATILDFSFED